MPPGTSRVRKYLTLNTVPCGASVAITTIHDFQLSKERSETTRKDVYFRSTVAALP